MVKRSKKTKTFKKRRFSKTKKNIEKQKPKKTQKGGSNYDINFIRCYEKNLENIQQASMLYSGKHSIDKSIANLFIENQLSDVRRQAALDLVENTIYITLEETHQIVEKLIVILYEMYKIGDGNNNIYIYSGNENKSYYFLSVLAFYYIKKHSFKEPIFIRNLNNDLFNEIKNDPLIILDDAAYSGSQLSNLLNNIYYDRVITNRLNPPNIFITILALNNFSKYKLERVPIKKDRRGLTMEETKSPFKLVYLPERLYEPLILKIGIERYFYVNFFFSLFTQKNPYISLYFDHKLADDVSTYKKPLLYGPIVPSNYNSKSVVVDTGYGITEGYELIPRELNGQEYENLLNEFIDKNKKLLTPSNLTQLQPIKPKHSISALIVGILINKLSQFDICKKTTETISFHPFINSCNTSKTLIDNIQDNDIINYKYILFMIPENCLNGADCAVPTELIVAEMKTVENIEISNKINSINCPQNWYKNGSLKMTCISEIK